MKEFSLDMINSAIRDMRVRGMDPDAIITRRDNKELLNEVNKTLEFAGKHSLKFNSTVGCTYKMIPIYPYFCDINPKGNDIYMVDSRYYRMKYDVWLREGAKVKVYSE